MARIEFGVLREVRDLVNSNSSEVISLPMSRDVFNDANQFVNSLSRSLEEDVPLEEDRIASLVTTFKEAWFYANRPHTIYISTSRRVIEDLSSELFLSGSKVNYRTFLAINDALISQTGQATELLDKIEQDM